jgi:hypothetical protein
MKKFAGMGNATTFPIQSFAFALVALASMIRVGSKSLSIRKLEALASNVHVFGDDIVIRREYYPAFAEWIVSCGLKINHGKTFSGGNFRESCGVDAYKGHFVTPVYLRHDPLEASTDPSCYVGVLSTCNQLWLQCMYSTAEVLRKAIDRKGFLPLVPKTSHGLGYHTRQDVRTIQRWNGTLHRFEVRTLVPQPVKVKDQLDGMAALMKFFHSSERRDRSNDRFQHMPRSEAVAEDHLESSVRRFNLNLRKRWVPSA